MTEFLAEQPWVLAAIIFCVRVVDVSMGTLRTIMVFRGFRGIAAAIAFIEVLLWVVAVSQVLRNLQHWYLAIAYAGGFATGNYVGMWIESKLALGTELVRAISHDPHVRLAEQLRADHYAVTELTGRGDGGEPVEILLVVEKRRRVPALLQAIREHDPASLCTLSDIRPAPSVPRPQGERPGPPGDLRAVGKRK